MAAALRGAQSFTRAQVADLIHRAFQSGYDHGHGEGFWDGYQTRTAEWNQWAARTVAKVVPRDKRDGDAFAWLRWQRDSAARLPRPGDWQGGPAPMWGDDTPDLRVAA